MQSSTSRCQNTSLARSVAGSNGKGQTPNENTRGAAIEAPQGAVGAQLRCYRHQVDLDYPMRVSREQSPVQGGNLSQNDNLLPV
jgi:hypothetical protein